jgi:diguanylate cyclase (GGDEF)-like protein
MLDNESSRLNRYGSPFSVAIIDVDHFKEINDRFGHVTGDLVLKRIAECLSNQKRNCDILARYGGDEFVFILPETTAQDAGKMIERIRQKIREIVFDDKRYVTISCGIAQTESIQPVVPTELVSKADIALYKAKQAGRNCVRILNEEPTLTSK